MTADDDAPDNRTVFYAPKVDFNGGYTNFIWMCLDVRESGLCDVSEMKRGADDWTIASRKIEYCLARTVPARCRLQLSQHLLVAVTLMNFAKVVVMACAFYFQRSSTLVTIGDAVTSLLCSRDSLTTARCLMAQKDVNHRPLVWRLEGIPGNSQAQCIRQRWRSRSESKPNTRPMAQPYKGSVRQRWYKGASRTRWTTTALLLLVAVIAVAALLSYGLFIIRMAFDNPAQDFRLGFGAIDPRFQIFIAELPDSGTAGFLAVVLLANTPQMICSFIYLAYNGLFTCMLLADEWSRYFLNPKPLRVTSPRGQQRSKYYLQLPFAFSVPLLATSAFLHWLISESIFLVQVDLHYGDQGRMYSYPNPGFSPMPILLVVIVGTIMLVVLIGHGWFRRFSSPMPVVGSCSVAIASACHPPASDELNAAFLPVAWGDVSGGPVGEVGHCSFTSQRVYEPVNGRLYAGGSD